MKVLFLYSAPLEPLMDDIEQEKAPDTLLWGWNHMPKFSVQASPVSAATGNGLMELPGSSTILRRWGSHLLPLRLLPNLRKYDIVFASVAHALLLLKFLLSLRRPRWVIRCLDLTNWLRRHHGWRRRIRAQLLRRADAIVCVSTAQLEFFHREAGFPMEKLHFIPFGSDIAFFSPRYYPNGSHRYVLSVGRDLARDYVTLIQAIRWLDIPVKIVASPRNLRGLEPLPPNVEVFFDVPFVDLRELYAGAAFVVIPTYGDDYLYGSDCSGQTVLLDAMAMGKTSIVSERSYVRDYVSEGETGIVVKPRDPQVLRQAILRLRDNPAEAERMGRNARRKAEKEFNTAVFAKRLAEVFKAVAAS